MIECSKCLFSDSDYPDITLDENGVCDICLVNEKRIENVAKRKETWSIDELIHELQSSRKGKYDSLIGISGGTDSTFMVYLAKKWGLNPLLMHVDGGWNSETSVINIERVVENSGFDFVTAVLPWHEMRDLQRSFIKANVIDIDLPFDNALIKYNYIMAKKYGISYVLSGYSTTTEGIMPPNFTHYKNDKRNIYDIHKRYGKIKIEDLKLLGSFDYIYYDRFLKIKFIHPLDLIDYNVREAKEIIQREFQWKDYGGKHYENVFTRFYQGYILPKKFNVDKRKSHLSMLICSNQMTKKDAEALLANEGSYPSKLLERDDELFFCKKLQLTKEEFNKYMHDGEISHRNFKSDLDIYDAFKPIYQFLKRLFRFEIFRI